MKTLLIIDSHSILFKSHFAFERNPLKNKAGLVTSGLYGFLNQTTSLIKRFKPTHMCFALDRSRNTFRRDLYAGYKAHRAEMPEDLIRQMPYVVPLIEGMGGKAVSFDQFEADDVLGSLSHQMVAKDPDLSVILVSGDRDSFQLVDERIQVAYLSSKMKEGIEIYRELEILERYGLPPKSLISVKALMGDASDNIPGVKGIGEKTALKLISQFQTLENLYANLDSQTPKLKENLSQDKESAFLSRVLATIRLDVPLPEPLDSYQFQLQSSPDLEKLLLELNFQSLMNRFPKSKIPASSSATAQHVSEPVLLIEPASSEPARAEVSEPSGPAKLHLVLQTEDWQKLLEELNTAPVIAFDCETTGAAIYAADLVGVSFCTKSTHAFYVPLIHSYLGCPKQLSKESVIKGLQSVFQRQDALFIAHNLKFDTQILNKYGIVFPARIMDTMLMAHLLYPLDRVGLKPLMEKHFDQIREGFEDLVQKDQTFAQVELNKATEYAASDALNTLQLYYAFKPRLHKELQILLERIELPLIKVIKGMEEEGIQIDKAYFAELEAELNQAVSSLNREILHMAGSDFNLNSTQQLADVLFNKMGIQPLRKTKTGYSTATDVLEELAPNYPICERITEYRHLVKLLNTYVIPLPKEVDSKDRIHSSFHQTVVATGRLSSNEPNLQNIPVRGKWGPRIRRGFVASKGKVLVSIDYSQIELRILAHLSEDENLIAAFQAGRDIHKETAARIFHKQIDEVEKQERESAKAINFGIVYGISSFGLSRQLNISIAQAKTFIEAYFLVYPDIRNYMNRIAELAESQGYIDTLYGRRRPLEEFKSRNHSMREAGRRIAINTTIQGTAAEILKLAMLGIDELIQREKLKTRMLLQVHDELILEVPEAELFFVGLIQDLMQKAVSLKVPLICDVEKGPSWGELESWKF